MVIDNDIIDKCVTVRISMVDGVPSPRYAVHGWRNIAKILERSEEAIRKRKDDPVPVTKARDGRVWIWFDDLMRWAGDRGFM